MPRSILVPLDGSALAERALPYAAALARAADDRVILARVLLPEAPRGGALAQEPEVRAELESIAARLRADGTQAEVEVSSTLFGGVVEVLLEAARRHAVGAVGLRQVGGKVPPPPAGIALKIPPAHREHLSGPLGRQQD